MSTVTSKIGIAREHVHLGLFAGFGIAFLALSLPAVLEPMTFWTGIILGDYQYPTHEFHHLVLGSVLPVLLLGVLAQAIRPSARVGALHSAIIIWLSVTIVSAIGGDFSPVHLVLLVLLLGMAVTHPVGRDQLPTFGGVNRPLAVVVTITAVGGVGLAATELVAHLTVTDGHVALGHYLFVAATALSIAGLAVYGALNGIGWRYPVYSSAFLLAVIGLGSILYPAAEQGSSLGITGGLLVVLWAIALIAVAEKGDVLTERLAGR